MYISAYANSDYPVHTSIYERYQYNHTSCHINYRYIHTYEWMTHIKLNGVDTLKDKWEI